MKEKIAIYPGTFDPVTNGHIHIIERSVKVFDKVIVAVANDNYKATIFSTKERVELLKECFKDEPKVEIDIFSGLVTEYSVKKDAIALIRGLRAISDFEYEMQMAAMNRTLNKDLETIFLMTDAKYSFISSTLIKKVACLGGDVDTLVPKIVREYLEVKYRKEPKYHGE